MRTSSTSFVFVLGVAALAACAEAGGTLRGGELTDAGTSATTPPTIAPDAAVAPAPCVGTGTRWSDLYNDIFGPTGQPGSCSYTAECHGSPEGAGARSPAGIRCFDLKGCRQSMLDMNLVKPADADAPAESILLAGILRRYRADGRLIGFMPQAPKDYIFSDVCVERIETWIRNGLPDD